MAIRSGGRYPVVTDEAIAMTTFDRFSERAQSVLRFAQEESRRLEHTHLGTEHLALGLVRAGSPALTEVLGNTSSALLAMRAVVGMIVGRGEEQPSPSPGLTPRAKTALELALDESRRLGHESVDAEHLLLGMLREGGGIGLGVFESLKVDLKHLRSATLASLGAPEPEQSEPAGPEPPLDS
jgi:ATP-dependent Clp protease ATP-binding subunit ClpC